MLLEWAVNKAVVRFQNFFRRIVNTYRAIVQMPVVQHPYLLLLLLHRQLTRAAAAAASASAAAAASAAACRRDRCLMTCTCRIAAALCRHMQLLLLHVSAECGCCPASETSGSILRVQRCSLRFGLTVSRHRCPTVK